MCKYSWHSDKSLGRYSLEDDKTHRILYAFHPKPTDEYVKYLGITVFGDEKIFNEWFEEKNFWYGKTAPKELTNREVVLRLMRTIHNIYI